MDFEWYLPCQPDWLCEPFFVSFSTLVLIGILLFIRLIYREYKRIDHAKKVLAHRKVHHSVRKTMERPYPKRPFPKHRKPPRRWP